MFSARTPTSKRLASKKAELDLVSFKINSLADRDFLSALERGDGDFIRTVIFTVPIREDNIKLRAMTGRSSTNSKEMHTLLKLGDKHRVVEYLHSLDDKSLREIARDPTIADVIENNTALSYRLADVLLINSPIRSPPKFTLSIPFSLEEDSEIVLTEDYKKNMQTLLSTSQDKIDEILDPELYVQDDVARDIRAIVTSPEYKQRRSLMSSSGFRGCESPYKPPVQHIATPM